jgi:hypothetical protein
MYICGKWYTSELTVSGPGPLTVNSEVYQVLFATYTFYLPMMVARGVAVA